MSLGRGFVQVLAQALPNWGNSAGKQSARTATAADPSVAATDLLRRGRSGAVAFPSRTRSLSD